MWYRIKTYIQHLIFSKSIYKIHSPFVYDLVAHVLENKESVSDLNRILTYRKLQSTSKQNVLFEGFGADQSKKIYTLSHILRYIVVPHHIGKWYYAIIAKYQYQNILELGTCIGIGSLYLALGNRSRLSTFEANSACIEIARRVFSDFELSNITIVKGDIDSTLREYMAKKELVDFVIIDANHTYEATLSYYETIQPNLHHKSLVVIDDIYWSEDMTRAWNSLKNRSEVTLSLDFYRCGFLFFDTNRIEKEHFKVWVND